VKGLPDVYDVYDLYKEDVMRIAIFGVGGVGGYFGGRLAQVGEDVVFLARGEHLNALRADGLHVESIKGDFTISPVQAIHDPAEVGVVDVVLLGVKAWQVQEAAQAIRPLIGPQTCVVTLQNGVEAPVQAVEVLGEKHVVGGLCGLISFIVAPGHLRHAGAEPFIRFGELNNRASVRTEQLRQAFERAGVQVEIPSNIQVALWMKFLFITPWSGIGAVTRAPVGVWRSLPETREMVLQCLHEIDAVAQAHAIILPEKAVTSTWKLYETLPPSGIASLQRDIMESRPSELEAQIGAVIRLAQQVEVPTPTHTFIYSSLLPLESRARGKVKFSM
jgi:2-dehydropantoate 2-reductase